jgi:putative modified peptide
MAEHDKIPPAGLHPRLVKRLLDSLETDDSFRAAFQESPEKALRSLGYSDPWECCLTLSAGARLASPEQIKAHRTKLEDSLVSIQNQLGQLDAQEGF